jgi:DNA-binding NtrC family response regulator
VELVKKIKGLNSVLPLIVLSDHRSHQVKELDSGGQIYGWLTPPVQMEKLAFMVRKALSSKLSKQEKKVLLESVRLSSHDKKSEEAAKEKEKSSFFASSNNTGYQQLFNQMLSPIFDQIIRDCGGQIYDRLLSDLERTMISAVLKSVNHNQVKASQILGISRNTLRERMKRFDIF